MKIRKKEGFFQLKLEKTIDHELAINLRTLLPDDSIIKNKDGKYILYVKEKK